MGYVPPPPGWGVSIIGEAAPVNRAEPPLNLDRFGMPRDFATYMWLLYRKRVQDESPARLAFLQAGRSGGRPALRLSMDTR